MGRHGGGGGGHSSGGHSSHRSSGGHSRSGGRSGGFSGGRSGGFTSHYRSSRTNVYVGTPVSSSYRRRYGRSSVSPYCGSIMSNVAAIAITFVFLTLLIMALAFIGSFNVPRVSNSKERAKIDSGYTFTNDCIYDDIDWIYSTSSMRDGLEYFYDKTGIQPVVMLHDYEPSMDYDDMEENTVNLYDEMYGDREDVFLYVYYDSSPYSDEDGYSTYCIGSLANTVLDDDAMDIFWEWHDHYWYGSTYSSGEEDEMFATIYRQTADTIMEKSTSIFDVLVFAIIAFIVVVIAVAVIIIVKARHKRKKEEAEETARILNADIDTLSSSSEDDLVNKYN